MAGDRQEIKEVNSIQYLRGIAALLVVFYHVHVQLFRFGYRGPWPNNLASGVDIFFVISGFIMWLTTCNSGIGSGQFLYRRFARIVPLYWLLTTFTVIVMLIQPSFVQSGAYDLEHIVKSYLFIPARHPLESEMAPVLVPGWTLNYEMFFYLVFAACLAAPARFRAALLVGALVVVVSLGPLFPNPLTVGGFYTSSIILEFALGVLIGVAVTSGVRIRAATALAILLVGAAALALSDVDSAPRILAWGAPAAMIVFGAVMYERSHAVRRSGPLHALGDASYSLYLSHGIFLSALGLAWRKAGLANLPGGYVLFALISVPVVSVAAVVLYRTVERPLIAAFRRRRHPVNA